MSLSPVFQPAAHLEFVEAVAWYEAQRPGLGQEFAIEVKLALARARANPEMFRRVRGHARKIRLSRFGKYSVYFAIKDDTLAVLSVFHGARNPVALGRRLK